MSSAIIIWNILLGSIGLAYLTYAKVTRKIVPGLGGIVLMLLPYFTSITWVYIVVTICVILLSYKLKY